MSSSSSSATGIMSTSKTSAKRVSKPAAAETPAPVAAPAPAPAAAPAKKAAAKKAVAEAVAAPAPVVAAPVAAPATEAPAAAAPVAEEVRLETEAKAVTSRLLALRETVSELISEVKRLEKKAARVQKVADKRRKRKVAAEGDAPKRPSIFQIPTDISPQLCAFMGRAAGSQESRSNVTKYITNYVKENNLKNKHDINADAKLKSLLGLKEGDKLTYFNLQRYLNVHYLKKTQATA